MDAETLERRRVLYEKLDKIFSYGGGLMGISFIGGLFVPFLNLLTLTGGSIFIFGFILWFLSFFMSDKLAQVIKLQRAQRPLEEEFIAKIEDIQYLEFGMALVSRVLANSLVTEEEIIRAEMEKLVELADWWKENSDRPIFINKSQS